MERGHVEYLGVELRITVNLILKKQSGGGRKLDSCGLKYGRKAICCQYGNEFRVL